MKWILTVFCSLAPVMASASLGPEITASDTENLHVTEMAWVTLHADRRTGCTDPTPQ